jgi:hypothetical protein
VRQMAIKPILFNTEMVRAILEGRKSCTRRLVKPQPDEKHTYPLGFVTDSTEKKEVGCFGFGIDEYGGSIQYVKPPYQPGDILYVRETWCDDRPFTHDDTPGQYFYRADTMYPRKGDHVYMNVKWHPSIQMPKEAARIWLKVTDVKVGRLQDITPKDAENEGVGDLFYEDIGYSEKDYGTEVDKKYGIAKVQFAWLWESTIKKSDLERYGWYANPWVWVIEFERCEKPEDNQN